jgi:hypothetical protein
MVLGSGLWWNRSLANGPQRRLWKNRNSSATRMPFRQRRFRIVDTLVHGAAQVFEERAEDAPVQIAFVASLIDDGPGRPARLGVPQRLEPSAGRERGTGTTQRLEKSTTI